MGGTPQGSPLGREGRSRRTIRKVLLALFLFHISFCRTKRNVAPEGSRVTGKEEKGCEQRNEKNRLRDGPAPWLPLGLRSRGAGVNDVPVACQSRA